MTTRSSGKIDLFVYGTLKDKRLLHRLTGKTFPSSAAYLEDFKKWTSQRGYPFVLPGKGSRVEGLLVRGVDPESLRRLDRYEKEGRLYFRNKVSVVTGKKRAACQTYVGNPGLHRRDG